MFKLDDYIVYKRDVCRICDIKIENLKLSSDIIIKLKELSIYTLDDLWKCKMLFLKENSFTDSEIHQIQIQLQLHSIDFNKKVYKI